MENENSVTSGPAKTNFVLKLFRGELSLPVTYWVFNVLIGNIAFRLLIEIIEHNYAEIAISKFGALALQGFYWFTIAYSVFILIAVSRSAGKYSGKAIWSGLACISVVLGSLSLASNLITDFKQRNNEEATLQEALRMMSKSLPIMVDEATRLDYISLQEKDIYYNYTLINHLVTSLDVDRLNAVITPKLKTSGCVSPDTRSFLNDGRNLVYMYRDKQSNPVAKIVVNKSDCI